MLQVIEPSELLLERVRHHIQTIYHDNPLGADLEGLPETLITLFAIIDGDNY